MKLGDHVFVPEGILQFPLHGRVESYGGRAGKHVVTTRVWLDDLPVAAVTIQPALRCPTCGQPTDEDEPD